MEESRETAIAIVEQLRKAGHEALFAGGCVRDMLMGNKSADYDIATSATPEEVMSLFRRTVAVGAQFGVVLVLLHGKQFEVATFRRDAEYADGRRPVSVKYTDAEEDALRRDFTINALFYDPVADEVIDYVDGRRDIERRIIRTVGDPFERFEEDKLRMVRAVRFATRFDFEIDPSTLDAMKELSEKVSVVSWERIGDEIEKTLTGPNRGRALQVLADTSLLKHILPEVDELIGVRQPEMHHPEGDVFEHTKLALDYLHWDTGESPSSELAFATLLHDIGKPPTFRVADRIRFSGHDVVGARSAESICRRLRLSGENRKKIVDMVLNHMRFISAKEMRESTLKKMLQRETFADELEMHRADCLASHGSLDIYDFLKAKLESLPEEEIKPPPLVNGDDLIELGLTPGPIFGQILRAVEEMQLEGGLTSKESAIGWIEKNFLEKNDGA
jgi:tRNA nucleotidyltransferase/poly(A) polymerase